MNLKERIKEECDKQGISVAEMLKKANVNHNNYYHQFIAVWKPRVAATLGVDEKEFFKGFENEIQISRTYGARTNYANKKESIINIMQERWVTMQEIKALTGFTLKQANALLSGIRYAHIVEIEPIEGQRLTKRYRVVEKIDKSKSEVKHIHVSKAPKQMHRTDALSFVIHNFPLNQFATSKDSIDFLKRNGKEIYVFNDDGGYKWL